MSQPPSPPGLVGTIVGTFVGTPSVIGRVGGRPVESAIAKAPVAAADLTLARTNLDGDRQADLTVHGGPDKAVYVYPAVHYPAWVDDGFDVALGGFGENLTVDGLTEHDVRLGDVWRWGEAVVEVSQPRAPCYKLTLHTGRKDVGPHMLATGRCGWYLRVLETGTVPTRGDLVLEWRDPEAPTIAEAFAAMFDDEAAATGDVVGRVLASEALADGWREPLAARRAASA